MEYLERNITVFDPSYVKPIYVVQGSNMFEIRINITDWNIPADADVYWQVATKTKGELNSANLAGNTIYINPYNTTFSEAGKGYLQVRIESNGKLLVSFSIDVFIQEDRVTTPTEGSNSDVIRLLVNQYVEEATENLISQIQSAVDEVIDSIPSDYTELESRVDTLEGSALKLVRLTQSEYDDISEKDEYTMYLIEEAQA